jgi:hypothetical protein
VEACKEEGYPMGDGEEIICTKAQRPSKTKLHLLSISSALVESFVTY